MNLDKPADKHLSHFPGDFLLILDALRDRIS